MSSSQPATTAVVPTTPQAGQISRQEFGGQQLEKRAETAASVLAAQARAQIEARHVVALQRPRDLDEVRTKILREIERPGFAEEAWYRKPIGEGVEGLSIRYAEAAMRCMGNISVSAPIIYEDEDYRMERVLVQDLESNIVIEKDIMIHKSVERRFLKKGQVALQVRTNSKGDPTYLVRATEDDLLAKESSLFSKYMRTGILRIVPGDIQAESKRRIKEILQGAAAKDPDGERKKIADAFAGVNVMPADLKRYLGHDLATCSPSEIVELRGLYTAMKAGEATWAEILEGREGTDAQAAPPKPGLEGLTDKLKAETAASAPAKVDPKDCTHPSVPPSKVDALAPGKSIVCPDCDLELRRDRQPGEDDGPSPAAPPADDPRAAVESVAAAANRQPTRQRKLQE